MVKTSWFIKEQRFLSYCTVGERRRKANTVLFKKENIRLLVSFAPTKQQVINNNNNKKSFAIVF